MINTMWLLQIFLKCGIRSKAIKSLATVTILLSHVKFETHLVFTSTLPYSKESERTKTASIV